MPSFLEKALSQTDAMAPAAMTWVVPKSHFMVRSEILHSVRMERLTSCRLNQVAGF